MERPCHSRSLFVGIEAPEVKDFLSCFDDAFSSLFSHFPVFQSSHKMEDIALCKTTEDGFKVADRFADDLDAVRGQVRAKRICTNQADSAAS